MPRFTRTCDEGVQFCYPSHTYAAITYWAIFQFLPHCIKLVYIPTNSTFQIFHRCSDPEISNNRDYPTFTRMEPPDTQATNSTLALLEYYKWKKFSIVTQKDAQWQTIAKHLRYQAEIKNFTINHYEEFVDYRTCCNKGLNCCTKVSTYLQ